MMAAVYLAGATAEIEACEHYRDRLKAAGIPISHDWMAGVRRREARGLSEGAVDLNGRRNAAIDCFDGVERADVVWLLIPSSVSIGAWVELGLALHRRIECGLGDRPTIIASGEWRTIFTDLVVTFPTHDEALHFLIAEARS